MKNNLKEILPIIAILLVALVVFAAMSATMHVANYLADSENRNAGRYVAQQCHGGDQDCIVYCDQYAPYNGDAACVKEIQRLREQGVVK